MNEAARSQFNAADPVMEYGRIVDIHPLYVAMALSKQAAEAHDTEPLKVEWDPAWPDLDIGNAHEYWSDLVDQNWELLSRWHAMALKPKGKVLHLKIQDGVESLAIVTPIMEYAFVYASRGWHVFPLQLLKKVSHKSAEYSNGRPWGATTDESEIRRDFERWPDANVGIVTGATSGFFVVETDTAEGHGEGVDGAAELAKLETKHGALPATLEAISPSGSIHRYFNHPGFKIKNSASEIGSGIDVRGDGGMVVAPPSMKPGKGVYRWRNELPIADAPRWLLDRIVAGKEKPEPALSISERAAALVQPPAGYVNPNTEHGAETSYGGGYIEAALHGEYDEVARAPKTKRNHQLNNSSLKLGHYVGGGLLDEQKVVDQMLSACKANGLLADDGEKQCRATIESGLKAGKARPKGIPERPDPDNLLMFTGKTKPVPPLTTLIHATLYVWKDPATIRRRDWLYGRLLLRKFATATISPGGVGKSTLIVAEALAMVSGKGLLGVSPPYCLRVWLWNLEDPQEETERKIQAAALHYKLSPEDIGDRLMVDSGRDQKLVIATSSRNSAMIVQPVVDSLVEQIIKHKIDVLVIDPFVSCHEVSENDNSAMDMIVKEWGKVADRGNCSVHLIHHTRKSMGGESEVTTDSSRGASSQTDACRVVRPINRMSEKEATATGVDNRRLYFRVSHDKANLQPPVEKADWFKLVSVDLGNGEMGIPGDSIGVVTKWELPDALAGITGADFERVARAIRCGSWRHSPQAKDWVGKAVADALHLDFDNPTAKARIKRMLGVWYAAKSLVVVKRDDDNRVSRKFVEVAEDD